MTTLHSHFLNEPGHDVLVRAWGSLDEGGKGELGPASHCSQLSSLDSSCDYLVVGLLAISGRMLDGQCWTRGASVHLGARGSFS